MNPTPEEVYKEILSGKLSEELEDVLQKVKPGHCMRLEGLPSDVLTRVCETLYHKMDSTVITLLSLKPEKSYEVTATKLIEWRNIVVNRGKSLLVLIPSTMRTAAEDSFDKATFNQLPISHLQEKVLKWLEKEIPANQQKIYKDIKTFFEDVRLNLPAYKLGLYILSCEADHYAQESWGKNLFYLELMPDSGLLSDPENMAQRLQQNIQCKKILTNPSLPLSNRIHSLEVEKDSIQKELYLFFKSIPFPEDIREIGREIVKNPECQKLDLANWPFTTIRTARDIEITVFPLKGKNVTSSEDGKSIVTKENTDVKVYVYFETTPSPISVNELHFFRIDLMCINEDGENEMIDTLALFAKKNAKRSKQVKLDPGSVEEGIYFFRVFGLNADKMILNRKKKFRDADLQEKWEKSQEERGEMTDLDEFTGKLINDSEDFYFRVIKPGEDEPTEEIGTGRKTKFTSMSQAIVSARLDYLARGQIAALETLKLDKVQWTDKGKKNKNKRECDLEVFFKDDQFKDVRLNYIVSAATDLRKISLKLLRNPGELGTVYVELSTHRGTPIEPGIRPGNLSSAAPGGFLEVREKLFNAILQQVPAENSRDYCGVVETCDILKLEDIIEDYMARYNNWMAELLQKAETSLDKDILYLIRNLQLLDHIELSFPLYSGTREKVWMVSPLHPLRLAWALQLVRMCRDWEQKSIDEKEKDAIKLWTKEIRKNFFGGMQPVNQSLAIHGGNLRSYYYLGELSPGWGVFSPISMLESGEKKISGRAILGKLQQLMGIPLRLREYADYNLNQLMRQLHRYIVQHPYVETLCINVFNPGDGGKIIHCLEQLQKEETLKDLRYEISLFAHNKGSEDIGRAFDEFLNPSVTLSDEAEAFIVPSTNALFPKIRFSRNHISDYTGDPELFEAHISILLDMFPVKTTLKNPDKNKRSLYCHGLVVQPTNKIITSEEYLEWYHYLSINQTCAVNQEDSLTEMFTQMMGLHQQICAVALAGKWTQSVPALSLSLKDEELALMHQVHRFSDWVITIDKNLGIDLFDSPTGPDYVPYLLDYAPGKYIGEPPLFLTTRPSSEIYGLLFPHMEKHQLLKSNDRNKLFRFMEALRSVSASIVMQLTSYPNKAFESIGIGLSRLLLDHLLILNDHFMIPIDMHKDLFQRSEAFAEEIISAQRGDFLLISFDEPDDNIIIQVIEVKCRKKIPSEQSLIDLKNTMLQQLDQTIKSLQGNFDPNYRIPDRLDRQVKNRQLSELLEFYLFRSKRYNLISETTYQDFQKIISRLDRGYRIIFNRLGFIFEFGNNSPEIIHYQEDHDLEFFHVGKPIIDRLMDNLSDIQPEEPGEIERKGLLTRQLKPINDTITSHSKHRKKEVKETKSLNDDYKIGSKSTSGEINIKKEKYEEDSITLMNGKTGGPGFTDFIGDSDATPQYGLLATTINSRKVALDLNGCNTISLFGVPGGGKSYTLGTIVEMSVKQIPGINLLPKPLASVIFHYNKSQDYPPEFVSMRYPNSSDKEIKLLEEVYGANPTNLDDILLLTPSDKLEERQAEYPDIQVAPIAFSSQELSSEDWKFLMGAIKNDSLYMQKIVKIMREGRKNLTLEYLRRAIIESRLNETQKEFAKLRLEIASQFIDDNSKLRDKLCPGRLIIVDLRDEFIEKDQALGLFVVMLNIFAGAKLEDEKSFNKLIIFDEAHKYISHSDLTSHVVEVIRQMRHQGVTMLMASQDPPSLPNAIIELSSTIILHKFNSPQWLKHIQKSVVSLSELTSTQLANLQPGEAYLWANKANNPAWTKKAIKILTRPRVTLHGGSTQKAIE